MKRITDLMEELADLHAKYGNIECLGPAGHPIVEIWVCDKKPETRNPDTICIILDTANYPSQLEGLHDSN